MKKVVLFLLVAVIAAGATWGQGLPSAIDIVDFNSFFIDETVSTESRYSAGIFTSYADDFLWFTGYDPNVGTFLLLGGYPASDTDVANTGSYLMGAKYKLNLGFAKSLKSGGGGGYLGVYYGGDLVTASGTNNGLTGDKNYVTSEATWTNRLAILYGKQGMGGIRFDILLEGSEYDDNLVDGKPVLSTVTNAPQIALGWGTALADGMEVYAQLGYKFANMTLNANADGSKKDTYWYDSRLALQAGISKPLASSANSESTLSVDFLIGNIFGPSASGDLTLTDNKLVGGGVFLVGADLGYKQKINVGKLSLGFKPGVTIGFVIDDTDSALSGSKTTHDAVKTVVFELAAGVDLGVKYQINEKFSLYTGIGLDIINWRAGGFMEGSDEKYKEDDASTAYIKSSAWEVTGFEWRRGTLHNTSRLGFGLTFEPVKNIVIGTGLNTLLDKIVYFDLGTMRFGTGLSNNGANTELGWLSNNIFGNLQFDLTITAKF